MHCKPDVAWSNDFWKKDLDSRNTWVMNNNVCYLRYLTEGCDICFRRTDCFFPFFPFSFTICGPAVKKDSQISTFQRRFIPLIKDERIY